MADKRISLKNENIEKAQTLARVFQKADRTITGEGVRCRMVDRDDRGYLPGTSNSRSVAPASSDGENITFDASQIGDLTDLKELVALNGLNYHELSHILYSPRSRQLPRPLKYNRKMFRIFNLLEDQRIESMFSGQYPATKAYFTMTAMKHLVANNNPDVLFPYLWGRKFLGIELRTRLARVYRNQNNVEEMKSIIDEFRTLVFPRDLERSGELTARMYVLMEMDMTQDEMTDNDPNKHSGNDEGLSSGRAENSREQSAAQEFREYADSEQEEIDSEVQEELDQEDAERAQKNAEQEPVENTEGESEVPGDSETEDADGEESESDSAGEGNAAGEEFDGDDSDDDAVEGADGDSEAGEDEGEDEAGEGHSKSGTGDLDSPEEDGESEDEGEDSGDASGSGAGNNAPRTAEELAEEIRKVMENATESVEEIMGDADIVADAESKRKLVINGDGQTSIDELKIAKHHMAPTNAVYRNIAKKVGSQFEQVARDLDPGFKTHRDSGRVNVQRAMRGESLDTLFDQWETGKFDAAEMEIVLGVDISGSMMQHMDNLSEALWTILQSLRGLGSAVSVTAFAFNGDVELIYGGKENHKTDQMRALASNGGTEPSAFLEYAKRIFKTTEKKNRALIMMTDGIWGNVQNNNDTISELNAAGITTGLLYFHVDTSMYGSSNQTMDEKRHNAKVFLETKTLSDLIPFTSNIVKSVMKG